MNNVCTCTHTYAVLDVTQAVFDEVAEKLRAAGYDHVFDRDVIDMHGIALRAEEPEVPKYHTLLTQHEILRNGNCHMHGTTPFANRCEGCFWAMRDRRDDPCTPMQERTSWQHECVRGTSGCSKQHGAVKQ